MKRKRFNIPGKEDALLQNCDVRKLYEHLDHLSHSGIKAQLSLVSDSGRKVYITKETLTPFVRNNDFKGFMAYFRRLLRKSRPRRHSLPNPRRRKSDMRPRHLLVKLRKQKTTH